MAKTILEPLYFLGRAAEELIKAFGKPGELLSFLTDNISHMHAIQIRPEDEERDFMAPADKDFVFESLLLIKEVVRAWYDHPDAPVEPMARGIMEVVDHMGADSWATMVSRFSVALSRDASMGTSSIKYNEAMLRHYTAFCLTISNVKAYEGFEDRQRKAA